MFRIENLTADKIKPDMLAAFHHRQVIRHKYVKINNEWTVSQTHELREWDSEKKVWITEYLTEQIQRGGACFGAFADDVLVGFCSIDGCLRDKNMQDCLSCDMSCHKFHNAAVKYANLTMLFVDDEYKRQGIGKALFQKACESAIKLRADKLFISAIPSIETVAFYFNMGCVDAEEIISDYVDTEEDRYLERLLNNL